MSYPSAIARTYLSDARADIDNAGDITAKPVMLRITSDLFLSKRHHSTETIAQFQEIALHLIDGVEQEALLPIAIRLARHTDTPAAIVAALMKRGGDIAAAVFAHSTQIDRTILLDTAKWGDFHLVLAIARRPLFDDSLTRILCERPEEEIVLALLENSATTFDPSTAAYLMRRARRSPMLAQGLARRSDLAGDMTPLFLWAPAKTRAEIVLAARRMDLGERNHFYLDAEAIAAHARLERLALSRQTPQFEQALAKELGCNPDMVDLMMQDETGESLAIALAALGMKPECAARILMMADPAIAHSVERISSLTQLVSVLPQRTAQKLAAQIFCINTVPAQANRAMTTAANPFASRTQEQGATQTPRPAWDVPAAFKHTA